MFEHEKQKPTFIEVCAGGGGLSTGLIQAGFEPLLLNDIDKNCCKTLKQNYSNVFIKCCSMVDINLTEFIGKVDLLTGGVPCQSFLQKGFDDPKRNLMIKFSEIVHQLQLLAVE